jgi:ankyrin repeat protein
MSQKLKGKAGDTENVVKKCKLDEPQSSSTIGTPSYDQITKNVALFNAIRKKPNEISEEARCKKVEKYLNEGADINAQDKNDKDNTVLHIAVTKDYPKIVKLLLEKVAKISILNSAGKSPLDLARKQNNQNLIKILTESINVPADDNVIFDLPSMSQSLPIKRKAEDTGSEVKKSKLDESQSNNTVGTPGNEMNNEVYFLNLY